MFSLIAENIKTIGACITGVCAIGGGYVAMDGPVPVSQHYVNAQLELNKNRTLDTQLQLNTVQRNLLRKEKFDRELDIQKDPQSPVKHIIQQRLETITDDLDNIEKEREVLRKEKGR